MPRDSGGAYTLPAGNPVVTGTIIESIWANDTMEDIAVQLNNVITRDGLLGPLLPMLFVDGTEALPGIAFALSPSTGLYRFAPNNIGLAIGGNMKQMWAATGSQIDTDLEVTGDLIVGGDSALTGNLIVTGTLIVTGGIDGGLNLTDDVHILGTDTATLGYYVRNLNAVSTGASAGFVATNDLNTAAQLLMTSSVFSDYPLAGANAGLLYTLGAGGLVINSALAATNIRFAAGGGTEQMRLTDGGYLGIGTDTPATRVHASGPGATSRFRATSTDGSGATVELQADSSNSGAIGTISNHPLLFFTNSGTRGYLSAAGLWQFGDAVAINAPTPKVTINGGSTITGLANWGDNANTVFVLANPASRLGIGYTAADVPEIQGFNSIDNALNIVFQRYGGNVGVGGDPAGATLHVVKSAAPATFLVQALGSGGAAISVEAITAGGYSPQILWRNSLNSNAYAMGSGNIGLTGANDFTLYSYLLSKSLYTIAAATGNIGINTVSPSFLLDVHSGASGTPSIHVQTAGANNQGLIKWGDRSLIGGGGDYSGFQFFDNTTAIAAINANGMMAVGKATPTYLLDVENASQAVFRLMMTGGAQAYMQANTTTDVRVGALSAHPLMLAANGAIRVHIPTGNGPIYTREGAIDYIMALDPGDGGGAHVSIGGIIFAQAVSVTGAALSPGGTIALGGGVSLTWQAFTGGTGISITAGTFRNIGAQTATGAGLWIRVA